MLSEGIIMTTNSVSIFRVPKMDCMSEVRLINLALEKIDPDIFAECDIPQRQVKVFHQGYSLEIEENLKALGLGATLEQTNEAKDSELADAAESKEAENQQEYQILKKLLLVNAVMFGVELIVGLCSESTGLIADSLDMFSDAAVYGLSIYAVGRSVETKLKAAHVSGWMQLILALTTLGEVFRRFIWGSEPLSNLMILFGGLALLANVYCLILISKNRDSGAHMQASWIFSSNDVIANIGVIIAGALVYWTGSPYPDLVIGLIIGLVVLNGARRILSLKS